MSARGLVLVVLLVCCASAVARGQAGLVPEPADDSATLAKYFWGGKASVIPPGEYHVGKQINVSMTADITVSGYGVRIVALPSLPATSVGNMLRFDRCSRVTLMGISFDGNRKGRGGFKGEPQTIRLNGCRDVLMRDCNFSGAVCDDVFVWCGVRWTDPKDHCQGVRVTGCRFSDPGRNCISVIHGTDIRIDHNTFADAVTSDPFSAVDVEPNAGDAPGITSDVTLEENLVRNCGKGLAVQGMVKGLSGMVFRGNIIRDCRVAGIYCEAVGAVIMGNVASGSPFDVNVSNCDGVTMTANVCGSVYVDTHGVKEPKGHTLTGNVCDKVNSALARGKTVVK